MAESFIPVMQIQVQFLVLYLDTFAGALLLITFFNRFNVVAFPFIFFNHARLFRCFPSHHICHCLPPDELVF